MPAQTPKEPPPLVPPPVRALRACARCPRLSQDCIKMADGYVCPACLKSEKAAQ